MPKAAKTLDGAVTKKKKPAKDPNQPKKPSGAYIFFCNDKRNEVKAKHPGLSVSQIGSELGKLWKTVSDEDKKVYFEQASADKERYAKAMQSYKAQPATAE